MFWIEETIGPCNGNPSAVEVIGAVGGILTSLVTLYLVHRRILADRDTRWHRDEERAVHAAVVEKLGVELAEAKLDAKPK